MSMPGLVLVHGGGFSADCWDPTIDAIRQAAPELGVLAVNPGAPDGTTSTWILTRRDRALSVRAQQRGIAALGGVDAVIPIDTGHMLMISAPDRLAQILLDSCRRYT